MRKGVEELISFFDSDNPPRALIFIAATGYGKTMASPVILKKALSKGVADGLIHVVPLRALVRKIYEEKFRDSGFHVGYQSHDYISIDDSGANGAKSDGKSPFFLSQLVVSTLDSYFYNIFRMPVAEVENILAGYTRGHYYPALLAIYSSINVFDEAHMYLGDIDESISVEMVEAIVRHHLESHTPFIVETATMSTGVIEDVFGSGRGNVKAIYVACSNGEGNLQVKRLKDILGAGNLVVVNDEDFCGKMREVKWETEILSEEDAIGIVEKECSSRIVLVVRNTVKKAVETFERMKCDDKVLVHGLLHSRDRDEAIKAIEEVRKHGHGVIVSTQVIEAGVETDASLLVTDPAPIENLAQRAGRLCRETNRSVFSECTHSGGRVIIVKPSKEIGSGRFNVYDAGKVKATLEWLSKNLGRDGRIEWRLLDDIDGRRSFISLLESEVYRDLSRIQERKLVKELARAALEKDTGPEALKTIAEIMGREPGLRDSISINIAVKEDQRYRGIHEIPHLSINLHHLEKLLGKNCIETGENRVVKLLVASREGDYWVLSEAMSKLTVKDIAEARLRGILEKLKPEKLGKPVFDYFMEVKRECYRDGIGLDILDV